MRAIATFALLAALIGTVPAPAASLKASPEPPLYTAIVFHEVGDDRSTLDSDGVRSDRLVQFFDWMHANGWHPVGLDDILRARAGATLPPNPVLLTFDDGYRSDYRRVFPLLLAYQYKAVFGLVGSWMAVPPGGRVPYGDGSLPREAFLSWDEVREMAASGLAEFASHSYDLHRSVLANPQGNRLPAAMAPAYDAAHASYETDGQMYARVRADLTRARADLARELGRPPRALVWPFGRFNGAAERAAEDAGFSLSFSLESEQASAADTHGIARAYLSNDASLADMVAALTPHPPAPRSVRAVCIDPAGLAAAGPAGSAAQDALLGRWIEYLRDMGANLVVLAAADRQESPPRFAYFPNPALPMAGDVLGRAVWQMRTRAGVSAFVAIDQLAMTASLGRDATAAFAREALRLTGADGIALTAPPGDAATAPPAVIDRRSTRLRRQAAMAAAGMSAAGDAGGSLLAAYAAAAAVEPRLELMLLANNAQPPAMGDLADYQMLPAADAAATAAALQLAQAHWLRPQIAAHTILALPPGNPVAAMRAAQAQGAAAFALCGPGPWPAAPPAADAALRANFSLASYVLKP